MIKHLNELKSKSQDFVERFLKDCVVEEKIDAPYIQIDIKRQNLVFRRSGRRLTGVDIILNSDYSPMMLDWQMFRKLNEEWFTSHGGCTIYAFYLPVENPIGIAYKPGIRYIIDRIVYQGETIDGFDGMDCLEMSSKLGIRFKSQLTKTNADFKEIAGDYISGKLNCQETVRMICDAGQDNLFASEQPEGYILRMGHKYIYQALLNPNDDRHREVTESARSQYEWLLIDFMTFWDTIDFYSHADGSDYIKTVCSLFNDYCSWQQHKGEPIRSNIDASGLEPPCIGRRSRTDFKHIPNPKTVSLCKDDRLMENVLKVLLVNLQKEKHPDDCILMDSSHTEKWNTIVKTFKNSGIAVKS